MSKLADPTICPDCRAALDPDGSCLGCGLRLTGPLAVELWQTMLRADTLVERLRLSAAPRRDVPAPPPGTPLPPAAGGMSATAPSRPPRRLPAASVPVVLLGLGGLCLLVSAVVFVAVAWSSLGLGARTAILLGVTLLLAAAARAVTVRGLRGAAETLSAVVCAMLALDLLGAHAAGLLGLDALPDRQLTGLVGAVLALTGAAAAHWSSTRATGRLHGPQLASGAGLLLLTAAEAWTAPRPVAATTVAVGVLAGLALLALRSLPWSSYSAGALALLSWLGLVVEGLHRLEDSPGDAAWWSGIQGWPLLAAAGYAAALALLGGGAAKDPLSRGGRLWRPVAAGAALAELAVFVAGPLGDPTGDLLIGAGVVAGLGVLALLPDPVWSRPAAVLAGAGGAVLTAELVLRPWASMGALPTGGGTPLTHPLPVTDGPAPWTALVVAGAVLLAAWCAAAPLPDGLTARVRSQLLPAVAPGAAGLAVATVVLTAGTPLWVAALAIAVVLAAACVAVVWQQGDDAVELAGAAAVVVLAAPALRLALASDLLTAALCAALAIAFLAGHRLLRSALLWSTGTTLLAALGVVSAAIAVAAGSRLADASAAQLALALAAWAVLSGLGARFVARDADGRMAVELTALLVGLAAVPLSPTFAAAATTATVVGSAVCLLAGLDRERDRFGWLGAAVLGLATLLRVAAEDSAPELATLPAAVVLLAAGVWRLRADPAVSSARALGSGLTLALLPSLLLALGDPVSLRGVLVGAAGVAVLAVGAARHWSAPFLAGAATTGVLAVRHLGPIAEALPRWVSLGTLGLALLLVGVTWEARRRDLTSAGRYVAGLR